MRHVGPASRVFNFIRRIAKDEEERENPPPPQEIRLTTTNELTLYIEKQLFYYLPEWITREIKLKGLAEHLVRNLLVVYQMDKK